MDGDAPLLNVVGLARSFGSLSVLTDITLQINAGELVSIVGPNGAGKTTLMRCLSDGTEPYKGVVEIEGASIAGLTPDRIVALGVGRKFQVASIFESLTVTECLKLARTKTERTTIGTVLRHLTAQAGFAAILVEHDLDFVREISSRIVVLHQGRLVLDGTVDEVVNSESVRTIYAGGGHV